MRMPRAGLQILVLTLLQSCDGGGDGDGGGGPTGGTPIIAKPANSGDAQSGTVGLALVDSLRVVVTQNGAPREGASVTWTTTALGAAFSPATSITDVQGRAATSMTLGTTAGVQTASAQIAGGSRANFGLTGVAGPAASLVVFAGDSQAALVSDNLTQPLQVKAADQFGNPFAGATISWSVISGSGVLAAATSTTQANGIAGVSLQVHSTGTVRVRAANAVAGDTVVFVAHGVTLVKDVLVTNNNFVSVSNGTGAPSVDTIPAGEAVRWIWQSGNVEHNIISNGSPRFRGINLPNVSPFTFGPVFFGTPGTYQYDCSLHVGMSGVIVVQ